MKNFLQSVLLLTCMSNIFVGTSFGMEKMEEMEKPNNFPNTTIKDDDTEIEKYELTKNIFVEITRESHGRTDENYSHFFSILTSNESDNFYYVPRHCYRDEEGNINSLIKFMNLKPKKSREELIESHCIGRGKFNTCEKSAKENIKFLINQVKNKDPEAQIVYAKIFYTCESYLNPDEMIKVWQNINFYEKACFCLWVKQEKRDLGELGTLRHRMDKLLERRKMRKKEAEIELRNFFPENDKN